MSFPSAIMILFSKRKLMHCHGDGGINGIIGDFDLPVLVVHRYELYLSLLGCCTQFYPQQMERRKAAEKIVEVFSTLITHLNSHQSKLFPRERVIGM